MSFSPMAMDRDGLTNLLSRTKFIRNMQTEMAQASSVSVVFANLDRFRLVNENFTYSVGDSLLQEVAGRIVRHAPDKALVGRFGGNEFVVACLNMGVDEAKEFAERLRHAIAEPHSVSGANVVVTASIGVAHGNTNEHPEQLIQRAELLTQQSKSRGRNQVNDELTEHGNRSLPPLILETLLRTALEHKELQIYYQPKIQTNSMQITGAEALCRWRHAEHGNISPQHFIPVAESSDLILPIDAFVLRSVCEQGSQWLKSGYRVRTSVNISGRQFLHPEFPELVQRTLQETGMNPALLELEITERTAMHEIDRVVYVMQSLRNLGVRTAIDDFGIGYSSLSYLMKFPVQTLKIDRSFTAGIQSTYNQDLVIGAIISLAKSLNLNVVAEGVETMEQLDFLRTQKCDEIQGYLLGEPVPPQSFRLMSFTPVARHQTEVLALPDQRTLTNQLSELDWLHRVGEAALHRPRLAELVTSLPDFILERMPFDRFSIELMNLQKDFGIVHEASIRDDVPARVVGSFVPLAHSGLSFVERTKRASMCGDILNGPEFSEDYELSADGIRSVLRVPLIRGNDVFGMLSLQSTQPNMYTEEDKRVMLRFATRVSNAIYAAQLDIRMEATHMHVTANSFGRHLLSSLSETEDPMAFLATLCERPFLPIANVTLVYVSVVDFERMTLENGNFCMRHLARIVHSILPQQAINIQMGAKDMLAVFFEDATLSVSHFIRQLRDQLRMLRVRADRLGDTQQSFALRVGQMTGPFSNMDALYRLAAKAASESDPLN